MPIRRYRDRIYPRPPVIDIGPSQISEILFRRWRPRALCQVLRVYLLNKILTVTTITNICKSERIHDEVRKVVIANGCFDLLHTSHIRYPQSAKNLGDVLILGIGSDACVAALKDSEHPPHRKRSVRKLLLRWIVWIMFSLLTKRRWMVF